MCKYQPWRFPGAIIKLPPDEKLGNVTFLLFRKGNINCTGAKDHRHLYDKCYKKLFEMLKKVDPNIPEIKPEDIVIQNIVATGRFEREIDLYNLALNEENVILSSAKVVFLLPIKIDEELIFEAISKHKESKKKMVKVVGTQQGVKFFEGEFATLRYDSHVLDIKLYDRDEHDK
jgi:hypothetical protein